MKKLVSAIGIVTLSLSLNLSAATLVSTIGDKDGFGIGATDGASFSYSAIGSGDGDGTDVWISGSKSWLFTYDLSGFGSVTGASLDIFHGGDGINGLLASVSIDGQTVGTLTEADGVRLGQNHAFLDTLDLSSYLYLFDGSNGLTINVSSGDGWALDYMELTLSNDISEVPVPAALFMFAPALLGFLGLRRKAKNAIV